MKRVAHVYESDRTIKDLKKRNLLSAYKKAKMKLIAGYMGGLDFKERKPKGSNIWAFRVNKQFRAIGYFDTDGDFVVSYIDNHQ